MSIRKGTTVKWKWGNSEAEGKVAEVHHDTVERTIDGSRIKKKGTDDTPAYLIEQDDGSKVLKLSTEVERAD